MLKCTKIGGALKNLHTQLNRSFLQAQYQKNAGCRFLLSPAFACSDEWKRRLEEPIVGKIKLEEFTYELDRKYNKEKKLSAVDVDLFVQRACDEHNLQLAEEMVYRLRRCPNTIHSLQSTGHALVRALLDHGKHDDLMRILDDRVNYGVFPDFYLTNLLMDTFIKQKNYTYAAKVASLLMLQEDFGDKLSQTLALYSCHLFIHDSSPVPWDSFVEKEEEVEAKEDDEEEEEEEVRMRVDFLREPFFDDHFDLREAKHVIGKTLAFLGKEFPNPVGRSYQIIGWALYRKWEELKNLITDCLKSSEKVLVLEDGIKIVENEIQSIKSDERRAEISGQFTEILNSLRKRAGKDNLDETIKKLVDEEVARSEQATIKQQKSMYEAWAQAREDALQKQIHLTLRDQCIDEIKKKKKELAEKEELLFFFENFEKHAMKLPNQPMIGPEEPAVNRGPKPTYHIVDIDEDYQDGLFMPPDSLREKFTEPTVELEQKKQTKPKQLN